MERGAGDGFTTLGVPLLDGEGAQAVVLFRDGDRLLPLEVLGGDVDAHRGTVAVIAQGRVHLPELIIALGDVGDGNGAVRVGFLGADHLPVPQDHEDTTGQGLAALVYFQQFHFYLGVVLKHQGNIMLAVPNEGLLHLGHVRA